MGEDDFGHISLWAKHPDGRLEKVGLGTCNTLQMPEEIEEGNSSEKYSTDHAPTNITFTLKKINRFKILKLFRGDRIPRKVKKRKKYQNLKSLKSLKCSKGIEFLGARKNQSVII